MLVKDVKKVILEIALLIFVILLPLEIDKSTNKRQKIYKDKKTNNG